MGRARRTFSMACGLCLAIAGCSTESDVQREEALDPSSSSSNGSSQGSGTGSDTGTSGATGQPGGATTGGDDGSGGTAGTAPDIVDGGVDVDDSEEMPMVCEPGPTVGSSVLLIGDSYVDINRKAFGTELQRLAKAAGALAQNDAYADRSVSGTQMSGGLFSIPSQYDGENNSDGHVKTVVMTGGGNDILIGNRSCITTQAPPASQSCVNTIDRAISAARTLLDQMGKDGVEDVVYFFYPYLPGGGLGGSKDLTKQTLDYAIPLIQQTCESTALPRCTFVDTRGVIGEEPGDFQDGVHPTVANINKIAGAVWERMVAECIAQ